MCENSNICFASGISGKKISSVLRISQGDFSLQNLFVNHLILRSPAVVEIGRQMIVFTRTE